MTGLLAVSSAPSVGEQLAFWVLAILSVLGGAA